MTHYHDDEQQTTPTTETEQPPVTPEPATVPTESVSEPITPELEPETEPEAVTPESVPTETRQAEPASTETAPEVAPTPSKKSVLLQFQEPTGPDTQATRQEQSDAWSSLTAEATPTRPTYFQFPHYFYAGFWMRTWAFLFDLICIQMLTSLGLQLVTRLDFGSFGKSIIGLLIYLSYFILLTKFNHGQTLGKQVFGLKVVCFNEAELSWSTVLIREGACRFMLQYGVLAVLYLVAAFTNKKQHLGDLISDTSVVTLNQLKAYQGLKN